MENLKETDNFLDSFKPPKINRGEVNNLNKLITSKEIKTLVKTPLLTKKSRGLDRVTAKLGQIFQVEL